MLWEQGIQTWDHFLACNKTVFSPSRDEWVRRELASSIAHLRDIHFFQKRLPTAEIWRVFETFEHGAVYLDIETDGGYLGVDGITVIGLYDGHRVRTFINGINLEQFEVAVTDYDMVITFNGSRFDLPFIRRQFKHISLPSVHIDLCPFLRRLGYRGGLKNIEKQLGIGRESEVYGMDGHDAVMLWKAYQWGDQEALDRLVKYNTADIINLEPLMRLGNEEMKRSILPYV
jgi:uncharacterized protein YprB with RNaseH-like and TPR domain